ncbi:hypothetical protein PCE1_004817 [Barthelona sp. PCE]
MSILDELGIYITDFILTVELIWMLISINGGIKDYVDLIPSDSKFLFRAFFIDFACTSAFGVLYHIMRSALKFGRGPLDSFLWGLVKYPLMCLMLILVAFIASVFYPQQKKYFFSVLFGIAIFFGIWIFPKQEFIYCMYMYGPGVIVSIVLLLLARPQYESLRAGRLWLLFGLIGIIFASIPVAMPKTFDFTKYIEHNAIYHVLTILDMFIVYRGIQFALEPVKVTQYKLMG